MQTGDQFSDGWRVQGASYNSASATLTALRNCRTHPLTRDAARESPIKQTGERSAARRLPGVSTHRLEVGAVYAAVAPGVSPAFFRPPFVGSAASTTEAGAAAPFTND